MISWGYLVQRIRITDHIPAKRFSFEFDSVISLWPNKGSLFKSDSLASAACAFNRQFHVETDLEFGYCCQFFFSNSESLNVCQATGHPWIVALTAQGHRKELSHRHRCGAEEEEVFPEPNFMSYMWYVHVHIYVEINQFEQRQHSFLCLFCIAVMHIIKHII